MEFRGKNIFNASFDVFADNYHSVRPGYPTQLFADIKEHSGINSRSELLEIGAGSGIATVELAKFGCRVVAIEPGSHLAVIAREQTKTFGNVQVLEKAFEKFQTADKFDAILAFTAFHWLGEGDRFRQVFDLLKKSGSLILVWNSFFQSNSPVAVEVNGAYGQFLPDIYPGELTISEINEGVLSKLNQREREVVENPIFWPIFLRRYLTTYNYDSQTYSKLLNTFPKIIEIEKEKRQKFLEHISGIIKQYGKISVPVLTTLIVCQKRLDFLNAAENIEEGL